MKHNRVTLITLGVCDISRSRAFYEALGWTLEKDLGDVAFYDMGGWKFGFFKLDMLAAEQGRDTAELGNGAMTLAQNYRSRAEVDNAFARAIKAGARAVAAPAEMAWGGYSSYFADPDGHIWEFGHNPFWDLDEDGWLA